MPLQLRGAQRARSARATSNPAIPARIVVASDGSDESMGALRLAAAIQRAGNGRVHAVTATETMPVFVMPVANMQPPPLIEESRRKTALRQLKRQTAAMKPTRQWIASAIVGWPTEIILGVAKQWKADAIVVGIGQHRPVDRLLAHETAVSVVRRTTVPVLAVAPRARTLPRRAIAAIDFTKASLDAAHLAAALLGPNGTITLVHCAPFQSATPTEGVAWTDVYETGARDRLNDVKLALEAQGISADAVIIRGFAGEELLRYAQRRKADLIAVGGHKQGIVDRIVIGSITTRILRGSRASVLVVPARRGSRA